LKIPLVCNYDWRYLEADAQLERLYQLAKEKFWDEDNDIPWDCSLPPETSELPTGFRCEWSSFEPFNSLSNKVKLRFLKDYRAWGLSQILHGEQGALLVSSQLVSNAPTFGAKKFAAFQALDEARHVAVFKKYVMLRFGSLWDIDDSLRELLDKILLNENWDIKFIGMQLIVENLALANFNQMKSFVYDPALQTLLRLVTQDESRHVAFGIDFLKEYIATLSTAERKIREDFAVEACILARENAKPIGLWRRYGWPIKEAGDYFSNTKYYRTFHKQLLTRIIPHIERVGLLTPRVMSRYREINMIEHN